jgi:hypothetical protein
MPIYRVQGPDGKIHRFEGPAGATREEVEAFAARQFGKAEQPAEEPDTGFTGAFKSSVEGLKGEAALLAGKTGLMDKAAAEKYYKEKEEEQRRIFKPTEEGWTEAPFTKVKELLGGSLPYMAAPLAVGAAAAAAPVSAPVAAGLGLGAAGLTSATQFTGSNLARQMGTGKTLEETELGSAALAAIPQAALDTISMRMIPGIGRIFGQAGMKITPEAAKELAKQGTAKTLLAYGGQGLKTSGIEGVTEAGQQFFERLQAGLDIADPDARKEYFESFIGGAVLGGTLSVPGTYYERSKAIGAERDKEQAEELKRRIEARKAQEAKQSGQEATAAMAALAPKKAVVTDEQKEADLADIERMRSELFNERRVVEQEIEPLKAQIIKAADEKTELDADTVEKYQQLKTQLESFRPENVSAQLKDLQAETKTLKTDLSKAQKAKDEQSIVDLNTQIAANEQQISVLSKRLKALAPAEKEKTYEKIQSQIEDLKKQRESFGGAVGDVDKIISIDKKIKALESQARPGATTIEQGTLFGADEEGVTSYAPVSGDREVLAKQMAEGKAKASRETAAFEKAPKPYADVFPGVRPPYKVEATGEKRAYTAEDQEYDMAMDDFQAKKEAYEALVAETSDKTLKDDKGRITKAGERVQAALDEMRAAKDVILKRAAVEGEPVEIKNRELSEKEQDSLLLAITDTIDTMRKGEFKGGPNPAFANASLKQNALQAITLANRFAKNQTNLINNTRKQNGLAPLNKPDEDAIKKLIGQHLGDKVSKATGWRAKEMKAAVETVMKNAFESAGLLPKGEDQIKTGFARSEFKDTREFLNALSREYEAKLVKTRVKAGEKPSYAKQAQIKKLAAPIVEGIEKGKRVEAQVGLEESRKEEKQAEEAAKGFDAFVKKESEVIRKAVGDMREFVGRYKSETPPTVKEFADAFNSKIAKRLLTRIGLYNEQARNYLAKAVPKRHQAKINGVLNEIDAKLDEVTDLEIKALFWGEQASRLEKDEWGTDTDTAKRYIDLARKNTKKAEAARKEVAQLREDLAYFEGFDKTNKTAIAKANKAFARAQAATDKVNKYYSEFVGNLINRIKAADAAALAENMAPALVQARKEANAARAAEREKLSAEQGVARALARLKEQAVEAVDVMARKAAIAYEQKRAEQQIGEIKVTVGKGKDAREEVLSGVRVESKENVASAYNVGRALSWQSRSVQTLINWSNNSYFEWMTSPSEFKEKLAGERYESDYKKLQDKLKGLGLYDDVEYVGDKYGKTSIGKLIEKQVITEQNTKEYRDLIRAIHIRSEALENKALQQAGGTADLQKPKKRALVKTEVKSLAERKAEMIEVARAAEINKALPAEYYSFTEQELTDTIAELEKLFAPAIKKYEQKQQVKETGKGKEPYLSDREYEQAKLVEALRARRSNTDTRTNVEALSAKMKQLQLNFDSNIAKLANPDLEGKKRNLISTENERILAEIKDISNTLTAMNVLKVRGQAQEYIGGFRYKPTKAYTKYARSALGQRAGVTPGFYSEYLVEQAADRALYESKTKEELFDTLETYGSLLDRPNLTAEQKNRYQVKYDYTFNVLKGMAARTKAQALAAEIRAINKAVEDRKALEEAELKMEAEANGMSLELYKKFINEEPDYRTEAKGTGLALAVARNIVGKLKLPKGVNVTVIPTLTARMRAKAASQGLTQAQIDGIRGGVLPDGSVFIVADSHSNETDLKKTIAHEITGHLGVEGLLGDAKLDALAKKAKGGVLALADDLGVGESVRAVYMSATSAGKTEEQAQALAFRELLAYTEEARVTKSFLEKAKELLKLVVGAVRSALRSMGLDLDVSTSDVYKILRDARKTYNEITPGARVSNGDILFATKKPMYSTEAAPFATDDSLVATQKSLGDRIRGFATGLWFRTQFIDRYAATLAALKKGVEEGRMSDLEAMQIEYYLRMYDQRNYFVAEIASHGPVTVREEKRADGKVEYVIETADAKDGKGLKDIAEVLNKSGMGNAEAIREAFSKYMIAERAKQVGLKRLNLDGVYTQAQIDAWVDAGRKNDAFQEARVMYREYNRGLLMFALKTGAITQKRFDMLTTNPVTGSKDFDYVPFYRKMGNDVVLDLGEGDYVNMGNMKNQPDLKRLVGGDAPILDFYTSAVQNTTMITDLALRNLATNAAGKALADLGFARKVGQGKMGPNVIRANEAGEPVAYEIDSDALGIPTELIVSGLEGVSATLPLYVRMLSIPADVLRKFITLNPVYAVRQVVRDSLSSAMLTGANMVPIVDSVKEITKMVQGKSSGERMLQGKGLVGGQILTGNSEDIKTILNQIAGGKSGWQRGMAFLESLAIQGDASTRIVIYNSFRKQGLSDMEASLATLESMNFSKRGVSPTMFHLNKMIPFLNAQIQGLDVLYRATLSKNNKMVKADQLKVRKKLVQRAVLMAAVTVIYAMAMQDDEGYQNATEEERLANWFVRLPGMGESIKVPIPFEVGFLFKAIPEALTNMMLGNTETKRATDGLLRMAKQSIPGGGLPIPAGIKPLIEATLNKSFYTGREIVGKDLERLDPELRYRDNTTELAKMAGALGISPVMVDYLIRGYTGGLGVAITSIANPVLRSSAEAAIPKPEGKGYVSSTTPIIGGLFQPKDSSGLLNATYDALEDATRAEATFNRLAESGRKEEAIAYLKEHVKRIQIAEVASDFKTELGDLTDAERAVKASKTMSPAQKRKALDELRATKIEISKYTLKAIGS